MRKITQTIVGTTPPLDKNVLWLDTTNSNSPVEKVFLNGAWIPTSVAGGEYYTKDEVDENFMGKIDNPNVGNILVMDEDGKAVDSTKKAADFIANPEVSGQNGEVLSVDSEGNPVWTTITPTGTADDEMSNTSTNAVQNKVIKEYIDSNFARQDGWYDTLVSGAAKNLVGHGTTPTEYTFRTSGGNADIGTGTASIDVMKGKTLKWQQILPVLTTENAYTYGETGTIVDGVATFTATAQNGSVGKYLLCIGSHKYYCSVVVTADSSSVAFRCAGVNKTHSGSGKAERLSQIVTAPSTSNTGFAVRDERESGWTQIVAKNYMIIDLTDLFGEGNEPTVAEFEALYPLDYYDYTATPVLKNNAASGIVTTGFNQWDEEWEAGGYNGDGSKNTYNCIRSKNLIPVFPGMNYYFKIPYTGNFRYLLYDANKNLISSSSTSTNSIFNIPSGVHYINFNTGTEYGNVYHNDICINLSWSGYRNGEYEPYEKHTLYFNGESGSLAILKGQKLVNGEPDGNSVYIFDQTGMKSAEDVYDFGKADSDGYIRKVTKRIGSVDLGSLEWRDYVGISTGIPYGYSVSSVSGKAKGGNIKPGGFYSPASNLNTDKTIIYNNNTNAIDVVDSTMIGYTGEQVASALSGVPLYYELATPEEYLLDTPIPANYIVNDFGTEQRIPEDTASDVMASISYTVRYSMNAVDELRRLGTNFIRKSSMDNILTALVTAGIIGSYTLTYNETDDDYDCTIEAPTPGE